MKLMRKRVRKMGEVRDRIEARLRAVFEPVELTVNDDSHQHVGHAGARPGGESHFSVDILSARFAGLNRVACHRLINEALAEEFDGPIHALAIKARAPQK